MKKVLRRVAISSILGVIMLGSTYAVIGSAGAVNNDIQQPKGTYYVYGDVDNNGKIDVLDVISVNKAVNKFKDLTGSSELPLEFAAARPAIYFGEGENVPQAADIDGDGYITEKDSEMIMNCIVGLKDEAGRCGQHFYIN